MPASDLAVYGALLAALLTLAGVVYSSRRRPSEDLTSLSLALQAAGTENTRLNARQNDLETDLETERKRRREEVGALRGELETCKEEMKQVVQESQQAVAAILEKHQQDIERLYARLGRQKGV